MKKVWSSLHRICYPVNFRQIVVTLIYRGKLFLLRVLFPLNFEFEAFLVVKMFCRLVERCTVDGNVLYIELEEKNLPHYYTNFEKIMSSSNFLYEFPLSNFRRR